MANILLLETSTQVCSVALGTDDGIVAIREAHDQQSHSELITVFIEEVLHEAQIGFAALDAVAVSKGPGSYTGLRIGVSTAKGICYACDIPLIAVDTLQALAAGMKSAVENGEQLSGYILSPMIDARRMEVYNALFNDALQRLGATCAVIVNEHSFETELIDNTVYFAGDGAAKCMPLWSGNENARFLPDVLPSAIWMNPFAQIAFQTGNIENLAYFEPFYLKDFVAGIPKVKGL